MSVKNRQHEVPPAPQSSEVWLSQGPGMAITVNDAATAWALSKVTLQHFATSAFFIAFKHKCNYWQCGQAPAVPQQKPLNGE